MTCGAFSDKRNDETTGIVPNQFKFIITMKKIVFFASALAVLGLTACEETLDVGEDNASTGQVKNSLLRRFPDYPPIRAFVNDSTLNSYLSAETFSVIDALDLRLHSRRFYVQDDTIKRPLKVGDYMNLPLHDGDVNEFRDDLVVCLIGMDKNRKHWWTTIKENDMRNKDITETDRPYQIHHYRAYDDDKGEMWPEINRLGIQTLPHNYLVDRSGKIIAKDISITLAIDKISVLLEKEKEKEK